MTRWLTSWIGASAAAFAVAGALGAVEGGFRWLRVAVLGDDPLLGEHAAAILPHAVIYGWSGAAAAGLAFWPAALLGRLRARPRRAAFALAVAGGAAVPLVVWASHVARVHLWPGIWTGTEPLQRSLLVVLWLALVLLLAAPGGGLADRLTRRHGRAVLVLVVLLVVVTLLYPDWRAPGRAARTGHLVRRAGIPAVAERPPVVLVTIDAWRRDHLAAAATSSPPTPHLDGVAAEGVRFARAFSCAPWTLPGVGGLLTGRSAPELGVERYRPLPAGATTLAEIAWRNGYDTAAFVTNSYLAGYFGFDRGFELYEHAQVIEFLAPARHAALARELHAVVEADAEAEDAALVVGKAARWLRRRDPGSPFFLWIHLMNPHLPYAWRDLPPAPAGDPAAGQVPGGEPETIPAPRRGTVPDRGRLEGAGRAADGRVTVADLRDYRDGVWRPDVAEQAAMATLYAREVQYSDAWLGRLFAALREEGAWEEALVVITSDHGEELFDHGGFEHGHSLLPEVVGVPLVVKPPRGWSRDAAARALGAGTWRPGAVRRDRVSTLALVPTVCAVTGWRAPDGLRHGSLFGASAADGDLAVLANLLYGPPRRAVVDSVHYRITGEAPADTIWIARDDPRGRRLLASPPADTTGLAARVDSVLTLLAARADSLERSRPATDPPPAARRESEQAVPADLRRSLRALGY